MKIRQRKFVGLVATIAFLVVYALVAMAIGGQYEVGYGAVIELLAFILLGLGWIPIAMVLIRWMSRPDTEA